MRIRGFAHYFTIASPPDARRSTDPVTQLWDLFSTGTPLCYIFDQLPDEAGFNKINNSSFDQEQYEANPDRVKKRAIALFAMQVRDDKVARNIPGCEPFTVTDLWDRNSTDGLVKVRTHTPVSAVPKAYLTGLVLGYQHSNRTRQFPPTRRIRRCAPITALHVSEWIFRLIS